jgi:hypothetical protein
MAAPTTVADMVALAVLRFGHHEQQMGTITVSENGGLGFGKDLGK